jgi:cystathionine beta-lyase
MKINTKVIHGNQKHDPSTGAVMPPIYQTSTYAQASPGDHKGYEYSRTANPTRTALENAFASIENGQYGLAFGSGLAAIDCIIKLLKPGDEVISINDLYGGTYRLFTKIFENYGIKFKFIGMEKAEIIENYISDKTKLIWIETPTNPMMNIIDIAAISTIVEKHQILVIHFQPHIYKTHWIRVQIL